MNFEKRIVSYNGMMVHIYDLFPDRPYIIFLHDSLGCIELWRDWPLKVAYAAQCNAIVYDRVGYGSAAPMATHIRTANYLEIEANRLYELLVYLNITKVILFGHSDGATIVLLFASKYSAFARAIICEAAHVFVEPETLQGVYKAIKDYNTTALPEKLAKYHGEKVDTLFRAWTEIWTRDDFRDWNIEHFLPQITCPLLFIQGSLDEYGTLEQVNRTVAGVSGRAEQYIIANVGHTPHKEVPSDTAGAVLNFINGL